MPTINQLVRKGRKSAEKKSQSPILKECPQKRGVCLSVTTTSPKNQTLHLEKLQELEFLQEKRVQLTFQVKATICKNTLWF